MKKNIILAFLLILMTLTHKAVDAKEFQQPGWESDYQVDSPVQTEDQESVRLPSSGSMKDNQQAAQKSDVESWKFEAKDEPLTETKD